MFIIYYRFFYYILYIIYFILYIIYDILFYYILYIIYHILFIIYYFIYYIFLLYIIYFFIIYYIFILYIIYIFILYYILYIIYHIYFIRYYFIYYILFIIYYILKIIYYILYYILYIHYIIYIYYMFGGFLSGYPWKSLDGLWKLQIRKKGFGGYPHFRKPPFGGLDVSCREDMFFSPRTYLRWWSSTWRDIALIWPYCSRGLNTTHSTGNIGQFFEHSCWIVAYGMPWLQYYSKNMFYDLKYLMCKPEFSDTVLSFKWTWNWGRQKKIIHFPHWRQERLCILSIY